MRGSRLVDRCIYAGGLSRSARARNTPLRGILLAVSRSMRVLEARFHPQQKVAPEFVVVGHVVWDEDVVTGRPTVQPSASLIHAGEPATMLVKLQYLVAVTVPETFERLQTLRSRFWSFVEVTSSTKGGD
jgi:hypothetical protein